MAKIIKDRDIVCIVKDAEGDGSYIIYADGMFRHSSWEDDDKNMEWELRELDGETYFYYRMTPDSIWKCDWVDTEDPDDPLIVSTILLEQAMEKILK